MRNFLGKPEVQWVAVCDLDDDPLKKAKDTVDTNYGNTDCKTYKDYRELFARGDLDAVSIAVPDHWHAILSIEALRAGLDVYGEKPFTHSLREGRALCNAVKRYGRVWQTGSWQRSEDNFHRASELVANGRVGKILRVEVGLPVGLHRLREDLRPGEDREPAGRVRLRPVAGPGAVFALLQGPGPHELALEHRLRRRPVDGLGGPPPGHRPLGARPRAHGPGRGEGHRRIPQDGHLQHRDALLGRDEVRRRHADHPGRRLSRDPERHEVDRRERAGSGWTAAASKASRPTSCRRSSGRTRSGSTGAATTSRTSSTACAAARSRSRRPRSRTARRASATSASIAIETGRTIKWDPDDRDDHRRPGGGTPPLARVSRAVSTSGLRRGDIMKTHPHPRPAPAPASWRWLHHGWRCRGAQTATPAALPRRHPQAGGRLRRRHQVRRALAAARLRLRAQGRRRRARGVRSEAPAVPEGTGDAVRQDGRDAGCCG